jgi:arylsulfatase A-like enzyme
VGFRPASLGSGAALLPIALAAFAGPACHPGPTASDPRPSAGDRPLEAIHALSGRDDVNILFILVDTLRADRLHLYGYPRATSPTLDNLGLHGVVFLDHVAQSSWTKSSMASLWTSLYPVRTGVLRAQDVLAEDALLPAERLREAGFRTAGIWRNGWVSGSFGFAQGFESYIRPVGRPPPASVRRKNPTLKDVGTDEDAVLAASSFLRIYGEERWFLYLHLMDVHQYVYDEDSARFGTDYSDVYDNSILRTNLVLERLIAHLVAGGHFARTLIVIASDHGEAFGEHGYEGHARDVHSEVTHVPFILSLPFRLEEPVLVGSRTQNVDIWPTLFELLGMPVGEDRDGASTLPLIEAALARSAHGAAQRPAWAYLDQTWGRTAAAPRPLLAVTEGELRLHLDARRPAAARLYDVRRDPGEDRDIARERPEMTARLRRLAQAHLSSTPALGPAPRLELDEMELNQLRALGYQVR